MTGEPLTVDAMDDTALVLHYRALGYHPDAFGFISEREAAASLTMCQKKLSNLRKDEVFEPGECRRIAGKWHYMLRALRRYHAEQCAPESW